MRLDVDNTLVEWRGEDFTQEVLGWLEEAKQLGFGLCILSNTRNPARLARIADRLGIRAIQDRFKPSRRMYMLALKEFSVEPEQAVMVGDQILTDVLGANRSKIEAIWVHRISRREFVGTRLNRIVERGVLTLLYRALPVMAGLPDPAAPEEEQTIWTQLSRFAVVGVSSFAIDFGIFMALFKYAPWHGALLSQEFGAWVRLAFGYRTRLERALHHHFRFDHPRAPEPKRGVRERRRYRACCVLELWRAAPLGVPQELNEAVGWYDAPEADYAVIGDPVAHSLSPRMHVAAYRELGLDLRYLAVRVRAGSVGKALEHLRGLGYKGANVTLPHKEEAIGWLETCDDFARRVRAVNTIRLEDRYGFNTDAPGFLQTLDLLNLSSNTPALVLGAGGAARAVVAALADEGHPMRVWSRTRERAELMLEEIEVDAFVLDAPELTEAGLIVNATSATLAG
ncbi:MAG: YqeG family HAD IIIA-type phosphatase, partial [Fimbriimonas ginsengisoli]|nr:YqeG family HAD IIIA-type phosphatase [Fimbriimonas ginsengisoli]